MQSDSPIAFEVRVASPGDVNELVKLHYRVFDARTHYLLLLGRRLITRVYRWYCESPDAFAVLAENDQGILGCATVNQGLYYSFLGRNWLQVARAFVTKPQLIFNRLVLRRINTLRASRRATRLQRECSHTAYLAYLAVDGSARGKRVGAALIQAAVQRCRDRGWEELVTCFHRANPVGERFYNKLGFEPFPELNTDDLVGVRLDTGCSARMRSASDSRAVRN